MNKIKSICVYCGSQAGNNSIFMESAQILGESMAQNGIRLVYGGGDRGIMGAVSDAVRNNGGLITGVIPDFLIKVEGERTVDSDDEDLVITTNMHERKQKMFEEADAFIALPGGIGTLEEIVEIMTWAQLDRHTKPILLLNVNGFWDPLLELLEHMKSAGFLHHSEKLQPIVVERAEDILLAFGKN